MSTKASHSAANYRDGDDKKRCGNCRYFRPPAACSHVQSPVAPEMLCDWFKRKRAPIYDEKPTEDYQ